MLKSSMRRKVISPGRKFMGSVSQLLASHFTLVNRSKTDVNFIQSVAKRCNRIVAEQLFEQQVAFMSRDFKV
ncbi:hypothetical protein CHS0354_002852 [Potamilus streckersoni]|uniref:Uncharacterized protein n=1 Tax=Potamilus streckersoni TaxID=2493646 RepID=A0AAE0SNB6_9BIVA|nr:hypothetical protein CHS0354_002852 [Potamilus streckersoni]